jgi:UDP-GlcNAc:undecaprenyl-phosphate GlcNAc-1-phosphate transferase
MPLLLPFLVCLLPLVDMIFAIIRRLLNGQMPFEPDRGHLHHKMLDIGHSHRGAVLHLYFWAAFFSFGGFLFIFLRGRVAFTILALVGIIVVISTFGPKLFIKPIFEPESEPEDENAK